MALYPSPYLVQVSTEVYTAQLNATEDGYRLTQLTNRSKNPGYDNQPSFWSEDALLYAATQNGQTDIVFHQLATGEKTGGRLQDKEANIRHCAFPQLTSIAPFV